jgi:hypothetical protein
VWRILKALLAAAAMDSIVPAADERFRMVSAGDGREGVSLPFSTGSRNGIRLCMRDLGLSASPQGWIHKKRNRRQISAASNNETAFDPDV